MERRRRSRSAQGQCQAVVAQTTSINRCSRACLHGCCRQLNGWRQFLCVQCVPADARVTSATLSSIHACSHAAVPQPPAHSLSGDIVTDLAARAAVEGLPDVAVVTTAARLKACGCVVDAPLGGAAAKQPTAHLVGGTGVTQPQPHHTAQQQSTVSISSHCAREAKCAKSFASGSWHARTGVLLPALSPQDTPTGTHRISCTNIRTAARAATDCQAPTVMRQRLSPVSHCQ